MAKPEGKKKTIHNAKNARALLCFIDLCGTISPYEAFFDLRKLHIRQVHWPCQQPQGRVGMV